MVKLSEVTDEHYEEVQPGPSDNDDDFEDYSDSDSEDEHHDHHPSQPHNRSSRKQPGKSRFGGVIDDESESLSDDDDDDDDDLTLEEGMYERLVALRDIIPIKHQTRIALFVKGLWGWVTWGGRTGGTVAYVLSTGVLMLGVPYALAVAEEGQMLEMEREMKVGLAEYGPVDANWGPRRR